MKIKSYETYVLGTPWRNLTYLFIELADGTRGVGEARVLGKTHTVLEFLKDTKRHFIGHDVYDIEDMYRRFTLLDFGVPGEVVMTGLALVEMACWDCIGKLSNQPIGLISRAGLGFGGLALAMPGNSIINMTNGELALYAAILIAVGLAIGIFDRRQQKYADVPDAP